jgi:hypothetical protein
MRRTEVLRNHACRRGPAFALLLRTTSAKEVPEHHQSHSLKKANHAKVWDAKLLAYVDAARR